MRVVRVLAEQIEGELEGIIRGLREPFWPGRSDIGCLEGEPVDQGAGLAPVVGVVEVEHQHHPRSGAVDLPRGHQVGEIGDVGSADGRESVS